MQPRDSHDVKRKGCTGRVHDHNIQRQHEINTRCTSRGHAATRTVRPAKGVHRLERRHMRYYAPLTQLGPNRWADRAATLLWNHGGWVRRSSWAQRSVAARRLLRRRRVVDGAARPESGELFTSAMEDEHLERTHRGQGALARLLRQQVATLEHGLVVWTEPVGECARWAPERGSLHSTPPEAPAMQRRPGGALWQAQSNQRCSHPRGMSAAISPRLLWAGGCSWAYQRARRDAALSGGALGRWSTGALGRWQAG